MTRRPPPREDAQGQRHLTIHFRASSSRSTAGGKASRSDHSATESGASPKIAGNGGTRMKRDQDRDLGGDPHQHEAVAEEPSPEDRLAVGAAGEDVADLGRDDARQGHRGGAPIEVSGGGHGQAGAPAGEPVRPEERRAAPAPPRSRRGSRRRAAAGAGPRSRSSRGRGGLSITPRLGRLGAEREGGQEVGAEVDGEDLHHGERQGDTEEDEGQEGRPARERSTRRCR